MQSERQLRSMKQPSATRSIINCSGDVDNAIKTETMVNPDDLNSSNTLCPT
ncbi:hypothetical protein [Xenorhabdus littoralis]|uniref:hypothetical protein n=1 Tax=Xenorhabdus littoralis TaxID=2582835 RepID=UPI0029E7DD5B|nr:hypothetical protein [Xenorhabdus sp. psl]